MMDGQSQDGMASDMVTKEFVVKSGTCSTCDGKVQSTAVITCKLCNDIYHAVCPRSTKQNKICNETLLKSYSQNSTKDNFMWYCDTCLTMNEHDTKCSLQEKLNAILLKFDLLSSTLNSVKNEVANNTKHIMESRTCTIGINTNAETVQPISQQSEISSKNVAPSDSDNAWSKRLPVNQKQATASSDGKSYSRIVKKKNATILLKCSENGEKPDAKQIREVAIAYGIPINRVNFTANNNAVISLPSTEVRDTLKPLLAAKPSLKKHAVANLEEKLPAITVLDIREELVESEFMDMMKVQNPTIATLIDQGEGFTDVTLAIKQVGNHKFTQVHATVSLKLRTAIKKNGDRIYIGLSSCRVVDKFGILRCYKCHNHSHVAKNCSGTACCGYCSAENHESNSCELKSNIYENKSRLNCINCKRRSLNSQGHSVFWSLCPINKQFREKAKRSVPYYVDNCNNLN